MHHQNTNNQLNQSLANIVLSFKDVITQFLEANSQQNTQQQVTLKSKLLNAWQNLVKELVATKSNVDAYLAYYLMLPSEFIEQNYRELFFTLQQFQNDAKFKQEHVLNTLQNILHRNGWKPRVGLRREAWYEQLKNCLKKATDEDMQKCKKGEIVLVECLNLANPVSEEILTYRIDNFFYDELFDQQGRIRANQHSLSNEISLTRHSVLPKQLNKKHPFCVKFLPENMAAEMLVFDIDSYLGGEHIPCGLPVKFIHKEKSIPAYWMEDIRRYADKPTDILSLTDTIQNHPQRLERIDSASFTITLLRLLLTNPENDNGDNYFLVPFYKLNDKKPWYRLMRVDNERILQLVTTIRLQTLPTHSNSYEKQQQNVEGKSIIYILSLMLDEKAFNKAVIQNFLSCDVTSFFQHILKRQALLKENLHKLFSEQMVIDYCLNGKSKCEAIGLRNTEVTWLLSTYISDKVTNILHRSNAIQAFVLFIREYQIVKPALALLRLMSPDIGENCQEIFDRDKQDSSNLSNSLKGRWNSLCSTYRLGTKHEENVSSHVTFEVFKPFTQEQVQIFYQKKQDYKLSESPSPISLNQVSKLLMGESLAIETYPLLTLPQQQTLLLLLLESFIATQKLQVKNLWLGIFKDVFNKTPISKFIGTIKNWVEVLDLSGLQISKTQLKEILVNCSKLKALYLQEMTLDGDAKNIDIDLTNLSQLKTIRIVNLHCKTIVIRTYNQLDEVLLGSPLSNVQLLPVNNEKGNTKIKHLKLSNFNSNNINYLLGMMECAEQAELVSIENDVIYNTMPSILGDLFQLKISSLLDKEAFPNGKNQLLAAIADALFSYWQSENLIYRLKAFSRLNQMEEEIAKSKLDNLQIKIKKPKNEEMIEVAIRNFSSEDFKVIEEAFYSILDIKNTLEKPPYTVMKNAMEKSLLSGDPLIRQKAFSSLLQIKDCGEKLPYAAMQDAMEKNLLSADLWIRLTAFDGLLQLKNCGREIPYAEMIEAMKKNLLSINLRDRERAVDKLLCIRDLVKTLPDVEIVKAIILDIESLDDESLWNMLINPSMSECKALKNLKGFDKEIKPATYTLLVLALSKKLRSTDYRVRYEIFYWIIHFAEKAEKHCYEEIVKLLLDNIDSEDKLLSQVACEKLLQLEGKVQNFPYAELVKIQRKNLHSEEYPNVRRRAFAGLLKIEIKVDKLLYIEMRDAISKDLQSEDLEAFDELLKLEGKVETLPYAEMVVSLAKNLQSTYKSVKLTDNWAVRPRVELKIKGIFERLFKLDGKLKPSAYEKIAMVVVENLKLEDCYSNSFKQLLELEKRSENFPYNDMVNVLCNKLQHTDNPNIRQNIFNDLLHFENKVSKFPYSEMVEVLSKNLQLEDYLIHKSAFQSLLQLGEKINQFDYEKIVTVLHTVLDSPQPWMRRYAIDRLNQLESKVAVLPYNEMVKALEKDLPAKEYYDCRNIIEKMCKFENKCRNFPYKNIAEALLYHMAPERRGSHYYALKSLLQLKEKVEKQHFEGAANLILKDFELENFWANQIDDCDYFLQLSNIVGTELKNKIMRAIITALRKNDWLYPCGGCRIYLPKKLEETFNNLSIEDLIKLKLIENIELAISLYNIKNIKYDARDALKEALRKLQNALELKFQESNQSTLSFPVTSQADIFVTTNDDKDSKKENEGPVLGTSMQDKTEIKKQAQSNNFTLFQPEPKFNQEQIQKNYMDQQKTSEDKSKQENETLFELENEELEEEFSEDEENSSSMENN